MNRNEYLLTCLAEECAEIQKDVCKALRFGIDDLDPHKSDATNRQKIASECCDLVAVIELCEEAGIIDRTGSLLQIEQKKSKVLKWMEYSRNTKSLLD